jgi:lipopolysaccharide transport system ATP-binding protein
MRWLPWGVPKRLVVLDDFFPNLLTGFRIAEYNAHLQAWPGARVLSTVKDFSAQHARYASRYPTLAPRVRRWRRSALWTAGAAYCSFLNNAAMFLPALQRHRLPFAMTLYPGGGFGLGEAPSDAKLLQVLSTPLLRNLIVTQPVTHGYVRSFAERHRLRLPPIVEIFGVVVNPMYFAASTPHGPYWGEGKPTLDICFVAEKYMPRGANKGYPDFIEAAHALRDEAALRFHVVGSFSADDIDVSSFGDRIRFHGRLETGALPAFFAGMDVMVSPNRPFLLHPGNFDGFPTGGCVEASLCGVAVVASDELKQDPGYADADAMVVVSPEPDALVQALRDLLARPGRVGALARQGQSLTRRLYDPALQIGQRQEVIERLAHDAGCQLA